MLAHRRRHDGLQERGDGEMNQLFAVDKRTRVHKDDVLGLQFEISDFSGKDGFEINDEGFGMIK